MPGLRFALPLAGGAQPATPSEIDASAAPGAELILHQAWQLDGDVLLEIACLSAPPTLWLDGLEGSLSAGASAAAARRFGLELMEPRDLTPHGHGFVQAWSGARGPTRAHGWHVFGFVGNHEPEALVGCSAACLSAAPGCHEVVSAITIDSTFVPPPPPPAAARLFTLALAQPASAVLVLVSLLAMATALVLRARPRR
jgi:hypothetical protein